MQRNREAFAAPRRMLGLAAVVAVTIVAACSETSLPTASAPGRALTPSGASLAKGSDKESSLPNAVIAQGLLRLKPLAAPVTVTKVISQSGGTIDVPGTDFQLQIPRGAFDGLSMTFTVTALAGSTVAYDFEPHGSVFNTPLKFVQKLGHTNLKGTKPAPGFLEHLDGAYFPDPSMIDPVSGIAVVTELLPADVSITWSGDQLTFPIHHFSGYLISTGHR